MLTSCLRNGAIGFSLCCFVVLAGCKQKEQTTPPPSAQTTAPQPDQSVVESPQAAKEDEAVQAAQNLGTKTDVSPTMLPSGLQYIDVKVGDGAEAKSGDTVEVDYTGWLVNGMKFDSSVDRNQPFQFPLGAGRVIKGWDEGVAGMKVGGIRKLIIPPDLAYGSRGVGPIPPDSTLIFEVKLLKVTPK